MSQGRQELPNPSWLQAVVAAGVILVTSYFIILLGCSSELLYVVSGYCSLSKIVGSKGR